MASDYNVLRCPGCDSTKFDYDAKKKIWICAYCGNEIHKTAAPTDEPLRHAVKEVLLDLSAGKIESAEKKVAECEKISADNVCTVIAGLSVQVFRIISGEAAGGAQRTVYAQIKRLMEQLKSASGGHISQEEEDLYESETLKDCGDAFGVLLLVFDTIGQNMHRDMVDKFFDASFVYAKYLNSLLLSYAMRNKRQDILEKIFANVDFIDCEKSLRTLLESYEDGDKKREFLTAMFGKARFDVDDHQWIAAYLQETSDSVETKIEVYRCAAERKIAPSIEVVMDTILSAQNMDTDQIRETIRIFAETKPRDVELDVLVNAIYTRHDGETACAEFEELQATGLFLKPSAGWIRQMVQRTELTPEDRVTLLSLSEKCTLDAKTKDGILAEILLHVQEDTDVRLMLLNKMLESVDTMSTPVLKEYILECSVDGERKPEVLQKLLTLDLNMSFFKDILSRYMKTSKDSPETKKAVAGLLGGRGLAMDSDSLLDIALHADAEHAEEACTTIRQAVENGTRVGSRDLGTYLEQIDPLDYQPSLIALLCTPGSVISDFALAKYVIFADEEMEVKLENSMIFASKNGKAFGTSPCRVTVLGKVIECNLLQGYVLASEDSVGAMQCFVQTMKNYQAKLNPTITVDGKTMKFKKFVTDNRARLSPVTISLCEEEGVFRMFF